MELPGFAAILNLTLVWFVLEAVEVERQNPSSKGRECGGLGLYLHGVHPESQMIAWCCSKAGFCVRSQERE